MEPDLRLRPFDEADLWMCDRSVADPDFTGPFGWTGFGSPQQYRRRWHDDRLLDASPYSLVVAATAGDSPIGWVTWRDIDRAGLIVRRVPRGTGRREERGEHRTDRTRARFQVRGRGWRGVASSPELSR